MSDLVERGLRAKRESRYIDFKRCFDPSNAGEWCELIKDIVAMSNSGGGVILVGLENDGTPSGHDITPVLQIDHAQLLDKIHKYTEQHLSDIAIIEAEKDGQTVAVIDIPANTVPIAFSRVGTYEYDSGNGIKQKTAFSAGVVPFRHGAKSEPGTTDDIRGAIERQLAVIRRDWMDNVKRIVSAPVGATLSVIGGEVVESKSPDAMPIRIVTDPTAPAYRVADIDETYPYRQKELLRRVNDTLTGLTINSYDLLVVRVIYGVDTNEKFSHTPKFSSKQYSEEFADWLSKSIADDSNFLANARTAYQHRKSGTGNAP